MPKPDPFAEFISDLFALAGQLAAEDTRAFVENTLASSGIGTYKVDRYLAALAIDFNPAKQVLYIRLNDPFAKLIEEGMPAYDLKPIMLKGPGAKTSMRGQRFADVPFRLMDKASASRVAKGKQAFDPRVRRVAPFDVETLLNNMAGGTQHRRVRAPKGEFPKKGKGEHASGLFADALRHSDHAMQSGAMISRFATIRRISEASPQNAWWVPRQPGVMIKPKAHAEFESRLDQRAAHLMQKHNVDAILKSRKP